MKDSASVRKGLTEVTAHASINDSSESVWFTDIVKNNGALLLTPSPVTPSNSFRSASPTSATTALKD